MPVRVCNLWKKNKYLLGIFALLLRRYAILKAVAKQRVDIIPLYQYAHLNSLDLLM